MPQVAREPLLHILESCTPGLAQREIVEQSTCLIFSDGQVITFNDETACRAPSPLGKLTGAVQAQPLLDLLRKMPEDDVTIEAADGELHVRGKNREAGIRMEKDILLPVAAIEQPGEFKPLAEDFCDAIQVAHQCAGKDESRFCLTCVHITPKWVEACDFFQICRWKLKTGFSSNVLVRHDSVKHVASLGAESFSETDNWVHFKARSGLVLSCRRYVDVTDFPDLGKFLSIKGEPLVLPKGLAEAVDKAQVFTASEGEGNDYVSIELKQGRLKLKGQGAQGWFTEVKKVKYSGRPLLFMVPPALLVDLVKKHSECSVTEEHLTVDTGSYKFVSCLSKPSDNGHTSEEEADEPAPQPTKVAKGGKGKQPPSAEGIKSLKKNDEEE